eukprot:446204-Prymnesium_polylepis.1
MSTLGERTVRMVVRSENGWKREHSRTVHFLWFLPLLLVTCTRPAKPSRSDVRSTSPVAESSVKSTVSPLYLRTHLAAASTKIASALHEEYTWSDDRFHAMFDENHTLGWPRRSAGSFPSGSRPFASMYSALNSIEPPSSTMSGLRSGASTWVMSSGHSCGAPSSS